MTPREALLNHYAARIEVLRGDLARAMAHDPEGVHDLRVELKKLRAYFDLVGGIAPAFPSKKRFKPFRHLAGNCSPLRDVQVQRELIATLAQKADIDAAGCDAWFDALEHEHAEAFEAFVAEDPLGCAADTEKKIRRALKNISPTATVTRTRGRVYNLMHGLVRTIDQQGWRFEALHDLRKHAKAAHYTLEIARTVLGLYPGADRVITAIKPVHQALGRWHDGLVGVAYLKRYATEHNDPGDRAAVKTLINRSNAAQKTALADLEAAFPAFRESLDIF